MKNLKSIVASVVGSICFAVVVSGCANMQGGGFGRPSQSRCSCGLAFGHSGNHSSYRATAQDLLEGQKQSAESTTGFTAKP
jgi:hypothetical protein